MNVLAKGFLTLVMVAIGIVPAAVLHADSLPALRPFNPGSADVAAGQRDDPEAEPALEEPVEVPEVEETDWDAWIREASKGQGRQDKGDGQERHGDGSRRDEPTGFPSDPDEAPADPTASEPEAGEDDGGLLGDLLGG